MDKNNNSNNKENNEGCKLSKLSDIRFTLHESKFESAMCKSTTDLLLMSGVCVCLGGRVAGCVQT